MILCLSNALGFFIQLFPCTLMIFLPFSQKAYRFRCKRIFTGLALAVMASSALFPVVVVLFPESTMTGNLFMLLVLLLTLAFYIWLVREVLNKKVLVFVIVLFYAVTQHWMVNAIRAFFPRDHFDGIWPYTPYAVALYAVTTALMLPIMLVSVIRPLSEFIYEVEPQNMWREFNIAIISTIGLVALLMFVSVISFSIKQLRIVELVELFLILDQILIYWLLFRESLRRKRDEEHRRAMEIQQIQYDKIARDMENTRRMRHDMRHHFNSLYNMLLQGKVDETKDYLSGMIISTVEQENKIYCRNMTVNGLLQYYVGLAKDESITCQVQAECGEMDIAPADLTVLFGNVMENAMHACQECSENPWISVLLGVIQGSLVMEISIVCKDVRLDREYRAEDGFLPAEAFLSRRTGGGYGLRSMAHTAQKYGGDAGFRFDADAGTFTARIRLNTHADTL